MKKNSISALIICSATWLSWSFAPHGFSPEKNMASSRSMICAAPATLSFSLFGPLVDIWWSSVSGAIKYQVEIGLSGFEPGTGNAAIFDETGVTLLFGVDGLEGGTNYEIYVRAICSNGDTSEFAGPKFFTSIPTCGDKFYDLGGPQGNYPPDEGMLVEICPENPGEYVQLFFNEFDVDPCCSSVTVDAGLGFHILDPNNPAPDPITSYQSDGCLVFSFNPAGNLGVGAGWDINVECTACPPINKVFANEITAHAVGFSWPFNALFNNVKWELGEKGFSPNSGNETASGEVSLPTVTQIQGGLEQGKPYDIYAWNNCSQELSMPLGPVSFTTAPTCGGVFLDPAGPGNDYFPPEGIFTTTIICPEEAGQAVELNFTDFQLNNNGNFLSVFNGDSENAPFLQALTDDNHEGPLISTDHSGCLTFQFHSFFGQPSPGWTANVGCLNCPPLGGLQIYATTQESAVIGWNPTLNAVNYEWEVGPLGFTPGTGTALATGTMGSNSNMVTITDLERASYYTFYVQANCGAGDTSYYSEPMNFSTQATCGDIFYDPGGPNEAYANNLKISTTICAAILGQPVTVMFNLFNLSGSDNLVVSEGLPNSGPFIGSFGGSAIPGPFTSTDPSGCLTFEFFSAPTGGTGTGWEASIQCPTTPVQDTENEIGFELFPNPGHSLIFIKFENQNMDELEMEIRDITGKTIFHQKNNSPASSFNTELDIAHLPVGTYLFILKNNEMTGVQRFLKL